MKKLRTLVLVAESTDKTLFNSLVDNMQHVQYDYSTNAEQAMDEMRNDKYDLLIIDKNAPKEDAQKINILSKMLFPDAAMVTMPLGDEDFIKFKMGGLLLKWQEAQSDSAINFLDGPIG